MTNSGSDGCTLFFDGVWRHCCEQHDAAYAGHTVTTQTHIDLGICVAETDGGPLLGALMALATLLWWLGKTAVRRFRRMQEQIKERATMYQFNPLQSEQDAQVISGIWTYCTLYFAFFISNVSTMTSLLGLVLLLIRLVYEVPKAVQAIRDMRKKKVKLE